MSKRNELWRITTLKTEKGQLRKGGGQIADFGWRPYLLHVYDGSSSRVAREKKNPNGSGVTAI